MSSLKYQADIKELLVKLSRIMPHFVQEVEYENGQDADYYLRIDGTFRKIVHFTGDYDEGRIIEAVVKYWKEHHRGFEIVYTAEEGVNFFSVKADDIDKYDFSSPNLAYALLTVLYFISNDWDD